MFGSGRCSRRGSEWIIGFGFGLTNPVGTWVVFDLCLCFDFGCEGGVGGE